MPVVLWHMARCTGAEDFVGAAEDFGGVGAVSGIGREGLAEEIGREGLEEEALGLCAGFFAMDFFGLTEASAAVAVESMLNFFTASLACLANLA